MAQLIQDLRFGIRTLSRTPGFTLVAMAILALGIGVNVATFTVANAWLLRPLDAPDSGRLVRVYSNSFSNTRQQTYQALRDRQTTLAAMAGYQFSSFAVRIDRETEQFSGEIASGDFFPLLGVNAVIGRVLTPADDQPGAAPVLVLSHALWTKRFGASRDVIGRPIYLNDQAFTVVGVAPRGFVGPLAPLVADLWVPLSADALLRPALNSLARLESTSLQIIGRLNPGVRLAGAQTEFDGIGRELRGASGVTTDGPAVSVYAATVLQPEFAQPVQLLVAALLLLGGIVLVIVCVNVANLVLARAAGRHTEMAIRQALGAGRRRLIRQLLTENLLLAGGGAVGGISIAFWSTRALTTISLATPLPIGFDLPVDLRVLAFTVGISFVATLVFGLAPALGASRLELVSALKTTHGTPRHRRLRTVFLVAQVSMSVLLLVAAGLFIRSFARAQTIDVGFDARHVLTASIDLEARGYSDANGREFLRAVVARLDRTPGIMASSVIDFLPLTLSNVSEHWLREGEAAPASSQASRTPIVYENRIGPGYFKTMQIPLVAGRDFVDQDDAGRPRVAIVNETLAAAFWPGRNAIGQRLRPVGSGVTPADMLEVVGIARDSKYVTVGEPARPFLYQPFAQTYAPRLMLLVRTATDTPASALPAIRATVRTLDAGLPVFNVQTMTDATSISLLPAKLAGQLLGVLGLFALTLAALGIYGVMAFLVRARAREIGVRLAIGATPAAVAMMVVRQALTWTLMGAAIGLSLALLLTRVLASVLYGVNPRDPMTFAGVTVSMVVVAGLAALIPARRASRLDPLVVLRDQ